MCSTVIRAALILVLKRCCSDEQMRRKHGKKFSVTMAVADTQSHQELSISPLQYTENLLISTLTGFHHRLIEHAFGQGLIYTAETSDSPVVLVSDKFNIDIFYDRSSRMFVALSVPTSARDFDLVSVNKFDLFLD